MALHKISKGLDLPIAGEPTQQLAGEPRVQRVALVADDYPGMKPRMAVQEGDLVARGQLLFENRKVAGVRFVAPAAGKVVAIHRGARRALQSVVIHLSEGELAGEASAEHVTFEHFSGKAIDSLTRGEVVQLMNEAGLWTALRSRPFSTTPALDAEPGALFVTATDSNPLAPDPAVLIGAEADAFAAGLRVVAKLTAGTTFLCVRAGSGIGAGGAPVAVEEFDGPHPSGTVGLHIHTLYPVSRTRVAWHVGYQDVIAIGKLFQTGRLDVTRVVSVAGPPVQRPRLVKTRLGASLSDVLEGEFDGKESSYRVISGSVLSGKKANGETFGYLGRFHQQISVLEEGTKRELLGWLAPGANTFSVLPLFVSKLFGPKKFGFTTTTHGSPRHMVPLGMYEKVMPMDILPTFLLRALAVGDTERAEQLGALELDEEDLALCTFVCPGKTNYGLILRKNLQTIEEEG